MPTGNAQRFADAGVVEVSKGVQQQHVSITGRESRERPAEPSRDSPRIQPSFGLFDVVDVDAGEVRGEHSLPGSGFLAGVLVHEGCGDAQQPRPRIRAAGEGVSPAECDQERLGRDVVSMRRTKSSGGIPVHDSLATVVQLGERGPLIQGAGDDRAVVVAHTRYCPIRPRAFTPIGYQQICRSRSS